jgi:hypothetical protein
MFVETLVETFVGMRACKPARRLKPLALLSLPMDGTGNEPNTTGLQNERTASAEPKCGYQFTLGVNRIAMSADMPQACPRGLAC